MYSYNSLLGFTRNIFTAMGSPLPAAETAATNLVAADLCGVDSHGVARLSGYVRLWEAGRLNASPNLKITHETPSTAVVDGDGGAGLLVAKFAMQTAIAKAQTVGTGWVAVKNSNHFGIAGQHAAMALPHDMIGIALTNASPLVAPTFSKSRLLGTNPIAVAIPANEEPPFLADFATTTAANGKLEILQRKNAEAPAGWVQDAAGIPTTNANAAKQGGALLPLGGSRTQGSHKGYALGSIVDVLSGVLSGANYGPWVPPFVAYLNPPDNPVGQGIGHFFGAMRIDAFRPAAEFKNHMDNWIRTFRNAQPAEGFEKVIIPGDPERELTAHRMQHGIELMDVVVADLDALAAKFSIPKLGSL